MGVNALFFYFLNFQYKYIFSDSKVIIEWIKGNYSLQVMQLKHWCLRVKSLLSFITQISFWRVSKIFNFKVDILSKKVVNLKEGHLLFHQTMEGQIVRLCLSFFVWLVPLIMEMKLSIWLELQPFKGWMLENSLWKSFLVVALVKMFFLWKKRSYSI